MITSIGKNMSLAQFCALRGQKQPAFGTMYPASDWDTELNGGVNEVWSGGELVRFPQYLGANILGEIDKLDGPDRKRCLIEQILRYYRAMPEKINPQEIERKLVIDILGAEQDQRLRGSVLNVLDVFYTTPNPRDPNEHIRKNESPRHATEAINAVARMLETGPVSGETPYVNDLRKATAVSVIAKIGKIYHNARSATAGFPKEAMKKAIPGVIKFLQSPDQGPPEKEKAIAALFYMRWQGLEQEVIAAVEGAGFERFQMLSYRTQVMDTRPPSTFQNI